MGSLAKTAVDGDESELVSLWSGNLHQGIMEDVVLMVGPVLFRSVKCLCLSSLLVEMMKDLFNCLSFSKTRGKEMGE